MSSAYYAPLVLLPAIITEPGQYKTRNGDTVTIHQVTTPSYKHDHGCRGNYSCGIADSWHKSGRIWATSETGNDIITKL